MVWLRHHHAAWMDLRWVGVRLVWLRHHHATGMDLGRAGMILRRPGRNRVRNPGYTGINVRRLRVHLLGHPCYTGVYVRWLGAHRVWNPRHTGINWWPVARLRPAAMIVARAGAAGVIAARLRAAAMIVAGAGAAGVIAARLRAATIVIASWSRPAALIVAWSGSATVGAAAWPSCAAGIGAWWLAVGRRLPRATIIVTGLSRTAVIGAWWLAVGRRLTRATIIVTGLSSTAVICARCWTVGCRLRRATVVAAGLGRTSIIISGSLLRRASIIVAGIHGCTTGVVALWGAGSRSDDLRTKVDLDWRQDYWRLDKAGGEIHLPRRYVHAAGQCNLRTHTDVGYESIGAYKAGSLLGSPLVKCPQGLVNHLLVRYGPVRVLMRALPFVSICHGAISQLVVKVVADNRSSRPS